MPLRYGGPTAASGRTKSGLRNTASESRYLARQSRYRLTPHKSVCWRANAASTSARISSPPDRSCGLNSRPMAPYHRPRQQATSVVGGSARRDVQEGLPRVRFVFDREAKGGISGFDVRRARTMTSTKASTASLLVKGARALTASGFDNALGDGRPTPRSRCEWPCLSRSADQTASRFSMLRAQAEFPRLGGLMMCSPPPTGGSSVWYGLTSRSHHAERQHRLARRPQPLWSCVQRSNAKNQETKILESTTCG